MTFLQPFLLFALPLAALPVIIHFIHLYRRRQVHWAAMIFLHAAQRMNKGLSRLRQILILTFRVLALLGILFIITRPLAGGWLGLTGGAPQTVMVLLDRSASMEQQAPATGESKRQVALRNVSKAIHDAVGNRSKVVLLDSATAKPQPVENVSKLSDLPQTHATATSADIPAMLQSALDYITTNKTGRTDIWLVSDLQQSDWDAPSGRWANLRTSFTAIQGVRFHLLCYPEVPKDDLAVSVERVTRRDSAEKAELLLDLRIVRRAGAPQTGELPLRFVVNGISTTVNVQMPEKELALQAHAIPIDKSLKRGSGRVEIPTDVCPSNNTFYFVFDEPPAFHSVIVSEEIVQAAPLKAALEAATDPTRKYTTTVLAPRKAAEIPWEQTALVVWLCALPGSDDPVARQLEHFASSGRSLLFLPPENPDDNQLFGIGWGSWRQPMTPPRVDWWRNDTDLLANTRDGVALPVGTLDLVRHCEIRGESIQLARLNDKQPLLVRSSGEKARTAAFLGILPGPESSSLARDGVVMFAMLHRSLAEGALTLGKARQQLASASILKNDPTIQWSLVDVTATNASVNLGLEAGLLGGTRGSSGKNDATGNQQRLLALNRPPAEDLAEFLQTPAVNQLFAGLDLQVITSALENGKSLTSEIWRTFLMVAAFAMLGEALLCLPPKRTVNSAGGFTKPEESKA